MPDVAIIGAGPAGSLAAICLARRSLRVTLVEQHRFPRDKVCGECLSALGARVLQDLGFFDALRAAGATRLSRTALHAPDGRSAVLDLPAPMWGLSRSRLDALLLDAARHAGAQVLQPTRCESIDPGPPLQLTLRNLITNSATTLRPAYVFVADGKSAGIGSRPPTTTDFGLKAHFTNVNAIGDAVELFGVPGHYGGVAPIESGLWNVAFSIPKRLLTARSDLDALFERICSENPALRRYFRRATRTSDWLTSPLPRFPVRHDWPDRIIPIGNAACAIEPIGGEGMGLALHSAELAANAVADAIATQTPLDKHALRRALTKLWSPRARACRAAAWWVSKPALCSIAVDVMSASNASEIVLTVLGKNEAFSELAEAPVSRASAATSHPSLPRCRRMPRESSKPASNHPR